MFGSINEKGPWTTPLNWNLGTTFFGEHRIEFCNYVRSETSPSRPSTFSQFSTLPIELQYRIVSFCDIPTLFRLMQVSSTIRAEAAKYFWAGPNAWYHIDAAFLTSGGLPSNTICDVGFLAYIQHLEVDFYSLDCLPLDWSFGHYTPRDITELRCSFWETIRRIFPRTTRVVVSEMTVRRPGESLPEDLEMLVSMCPAGVEVSASLLREVVDNSRFLLQRSLWQRERTGNSNLGDWKEVSKEWMRQGIIPPPKQFHGPVGMYNRNNYRFENRYGLQREGFRLVRLEALERHHFDGRHEPFDCFEPGCAARFEQPGEWTVHAISTRHDRTAILPKVLAAKTNQREEEIQSMVREYESYWEKLIEECGEEGSAKQQSAKEAFLHQLENDPLYALGVPGTQTYSWDQYCKGMHWNRGYEELLPESSRLLHE